MKIPENVLGYFGCLQSDGSKIPNVFIQKKRPRLHRGLYPPNHLGLYFHFFSDSRIYFLLAIEEF